jgi:predicted nucleic acid-binding protein
MSSEIVVDASLAVKWVLIENWSVEARVQLAAWEDQHIRRIVPSWFACEIANVLYQ